MFSFVRMFKFKRFNLVPVSNGLYKKFFFVISFSQEIMEFSVMLLVFTYQNFSSQETFLQNEFLKDFEKNFERSGCITEGHTVTKYLWRIINELNVFDNMVVPETVSVFYYYEVLHLH